MPQALEVLDATVRRKEQGENVGITTLDEILTKALALRDNCRVAPPLMVTHLTTDQSLAGFDFISQPSLDWERIMALAERIFIDRAEIVHFLGPPGTGESHLATALAVEPAKGGRSAVFSTLADLNASMCKAERDGTLRGQIGRATPVSARRSTNDVSAAGCSLSCADDAVRDAAAGERLTAAAVVVSPVGVQLRGTLALSSSAEKD